VKTSAAVTLVAGANEVQSTARALLIANTFENCAVIRVCSDLTPQALFTVNLHLKVLDCR